MTAQIDFSKPIQVTLTNGGTLNFNLDMKIPGQAQIAAALEAIATAAAHGSKQTYSDVKKFEVLGGGYDRSKLTDHGTVIGNY